MRNAHPLLDKVGLRIDTFLPRQFAIVENHLRDGTAADKTDTAAVNEKRRRENGGHERAMVHVKRCSRRLVHVLGRIYHSAVQGPTATQHDAGCRTGTEHHCGAVMRIEVERVRIKAVVVAQEVGLGGKAGRAILLVHVEHLAYVVVVGKAVDRIVEPHGCGVRRVCGRFHNYAERKGRQSVLRVFDKLRIAERTVLVGRVRYGVRRFGGIPGFVQPP